MVAEPRDSGEAPGRAGAGRVTDSRRKARLARDYVHEIIIVVDVDVGGCLNLEETVNKKYVLYTSA